jgi:zinc transporter
LRLLADGHTTFVPVAPEDLATLVRDGAWVDAIGIDDVTLASVAVELGFPEAVIGWLADPARSHRPRVVHGVLTFGVRSARDDVPTLVLTSDDRILTVHASADELVDRAAAVTGDQRGPGAPARRVLGLVDELVERYDAAFERMARDHESYESAVLTSSGDEQSAGDVIADGLRLANEINHVQEPLRQLQEITSGLHRLVAMTDESSHASAAIDVRTQAIAALQSDLDGLSHRLEVATNARMSMISERQTEISKAIGAWGGVFAVNAVITGWYGMNIADLPGSGSWVIAGAVMVVATIALVLLFRRVDWL